ncbi:MAG: ABC transporter ATP-binding protein [Alphaproteobacteria bacterium]
MENLVEIRDLCVDFTTPRGRVHALRNIDIDVKKKRILGVVGESGSGKSTVIWAMLRLLASNGIVEQGEVRYGEDNVLNYKADKLLKFRNEQVSVVFQDPMTSQIPVLSYGQQMDDIQYRTKRSSREKRKVSVDMLRRVGIPDPESRISQYPHNFSGGMRQRAGIAMALLMRPGLLIADEPTTALDVTMEAQIIHLLRELKEEMEATLIVVSHNLGLVAELCDDVVVLYAGEVLEQGSCEDIFHNPAHPYTRALLECDPARVEEKSRILPVIAGEVPNLRQPPKGCVFAARCSNAGSGCSKVRPPDVKLGETQHVRCHLHADILPEAEKPKDGASGQSASDSSARHSIAEQDALVSIKNLQVRFRTMGMTKALLTGNKTPYVDAVLDVSMDLRKGETLGLVGESGSGKTTFGRTILGLVPAHSGSVTFEGQELIGLPESRFKPLRRDMAMMFQDPVGSLSPRQSVRALLAEPLEIHGRAGGDTSLDNESRRLLDMVQLPSDFLSRYPHELSGGQARRVGVARALALQPKLIIADEPTAGLDVSVQGEILNLMNRLQREHELTYLIITHNLPVVRHISDRLAIMYLGRIVEFGDSEQIFNAPAHPYTEALVRGVPKPDPSKRRQLISIEGEVPSLANRPSGCEFHARCKYATDRCRVEAPGNTVMADGRTVTCHYPLTDTIAQAS